MHDRERHVSPSLAVIEEELRAAEAYLTQHNDTSIGSYDGTERNARQNGAIESAGFHTVEGNARAQYETNGDALFQRTPKTRPVLSEERRQEILAKLSLERQAVLRARTQESQPYSEMTDLGGRSRPDSTYKTEEERNQLIQMLIQSRDERMHARQEDIDSSSRHDEVLYRQGISQEESYTKRFLPQYPGSDNDHLENHSSVRSESEDDDDRELFYASDIWGKDLTADIASRPQMEFISPYDEVHGNSSFGEASGPIFGIDRESPATFAAAQNTTAASSTAARVLSRPFSEMKSSNSNEMNDFTGSKYDFILPTDYSMESTQPFQRKSMFTGADQQDNGEQLSPRSPQKTHHVSKHFVSQNSLDSFPNEEMPRRATHTTDISKRIEFLAQPRIQTFAEREKRRLLLEMEKLQECTFRPNIQKPAGKAHTDFNYDKNAKGGKVKTDYRSTRPGTTAFPWLTLSPRRKSTGVTPDEQSYAALGRKKAQGVIERLHLDGTTRYDMRERAKKELEEEQMRSCTFRPKINNTSKAMASVANYKPIHHRVLDLQRAKVEYIRKLREQLEQEEGQSLSFTPQINPRSREIATTVFESKELEKNRLEKENCDDATEQLEHQLKQPNVIKRLADDADELMQRRLAVQEYYDTLNQQPFTPSINENSNKIVEQRPEFKMDFVTRQRYYETRDQEKLEALEDYCESGNHARERVTFHPDIGNANDILKQLRPEQITETKQETLYRLIYKDPKKIELKKQRLREKEYAKYTFKPEINPVSKALGRPSTMDELAQPVVDTVEILKNTDTRLSPLKDHDDINNSSRAALKHYFAGKRFRSRVALEMDQAEKAECTFRPTLTSARTGSHSALKTTSKERRSQSMWKSDNILHLIEHERQKKEEELETKRNELELKELEECTFQPNIRKKSSGTGPNASKSSPSPPHHHKPEGKSPIDKYGKQQPIIVRGLGRFLELRELAKKQQEEQKQREEKVFCPNVSYEPRSYTVPKPFNLSTASKDSIRRRLKVREELRAKERKECTFKPVTMESQNRKALASILND